MFIHGGYWRGQMKEDYVFVADGIVATGAIAAIVEYTLIPVGRDGPVPGGVRMTDQVREIRQAARWLADNAAAFGGDPARLSASGHSAGGHLVALFAARAPHEPELPAPRLTAIMPVSGLFDLRPIATSYLQTDLHLSADEVARWSPFEAIPSTGTQFEIVVGGDETPRFQPAGATMPSCSPATAPRMSGAQCRARSICRWYESSAASARCGRCWRKLSSGAESRNDIQ